LVDSYYGKTYVAYLDISGFEAMMKDLESAKNVLNDFYTTIYHFCQNNTTTSPRICAIVAFDCAAFFTRNHNRSDKLNGLLSILRFVREVNRHFIEGEGSQPFMTTCSIAYGKFVYEDRTESPDLRKNYIFGSPYLQVALDQKKGIPKIRAGECRLLPSKMFRLKGFGKNDLLSFILKRGRRHYFYWMLNDPGQQHNFDTDYAEAYKQRNKDNYSCVIKVLRRYSNMAVQKKNEACVRLVRKSELKNALRNQSSSSQTF